MRKSRGPALVFDSPSDMMTAAVSNNSSRNRYEKISLPEDRVGSSRSTNPFADDDDLERQSFPSAVDSSNPFCSSHNSSSSKRNEILSPLQPSLLTASRNFGSLKSKKYQLPVPPPPPPRPKRTLTTSNSSKSLEMIELATNSGEARQDLDSVPLSSKQTNSNSDEDRILRFLVSKRVYGFPGGSTSVPSNYCRYVSNNHPFFSICFAHRLHPFGKKQRLLVFLNGLFFAIFISFIFFETTLVPRVRHCVLCS